jgi:hypothetical protein
MRHKFKKLPKTPVCQCSDTCKNPPLKGKPWCKDHKTACPMSPVNGFEPLLEIDVWNTNYALRESHNCLAYALNNVDKELFKKCETTPSCDVDFPQPGYESGYIQFSTNTKKCCADMVLRMEGDNPNIIPTTFNDICPKKMSKIALIVDPKRDYHYLRQDPDGKWSHKPGSLIVKREDSSGREILRPDRATFMYPSKTDPLFYLYFCGYYCVPRDKKLYMTTRVKKGGFSFSRKSMKTRRLKKKKNETRL